MAKNARWGQKSATPNIILAGRTPAAHQLFGGKTLAQIGAELDLGDEDVKWGFGTNPQNNQEIVSLMIHNPQTDTWYQIPVSRGLTEEMRSNPDVLLSCVFRTSYLSVKNADGTPKTDENGNIVTDEKQPYMSFGRPSGIVVERMEDAFTAPVEADTTVV